MSSPTVTVPPPGDHGHDPGLADHVARAVGQDEPLEQARPEVVDLLARVAQTGHLEDDVGTEVQAGAARQPQQVDAARRHVLAQVGRSDVEARLGELVEQLGVHEVDLAQVGLRRVGPHPAAVLHGLAGVRVPDDAQTFDDLHAGTQVLAEVVGRAGGHRHDPGHGFGHGQHHGVPARPTARVSSPRRRGRRDAPLAWHALCVRRPLREAPSA